MVKIGQELIIWSRESDLGLKSFADSALAKSNNLLLPYYDMVARRAKEAANGFVFSSVDCAMNKVMVGNNREEPPCGACTKSKQRGRLYINRVYEPHVERAHLKTNSEHIANDPTKANIEIVALRRENKR